MLDRHWIEQHLPQRGAMCLLDEVLSWDREHALCRSATHRRADHPLRAYDRLGSACAIEYAAQAAAVHGALLAQQDCHFDTRGATHDTTPTTRFGMLASARAVELAAARLDQLAADLLVRVTCLHADADSALYEFMLNELRRGAAARAPAADPLARGRLSLWLNPAATQVRIP